MLHHSIFITTLLTSHVAVSLAGDIVEARSGLGPFLGLNSAPPRPPRVASLSSEDAKPDTIINVDPSAAARHTLYTYDNNTEATFPWLVSPASGTVYGLSNSKLYPNATLVDVFDTIGDAPWVRKAQFPVPEGCSVIGLAAGAASGISVLFTYDHHTITLGNFMPPNTTMRPIGSYTAGPGEKIGSMGNCIVTTDEAMVVCVVDTPNSQLDTQVITISRAGVFSLIAPPALSGLTSLAFDSSFYYVAGIGPGPSFAPKLGTFNPSSGQWRPMVDFADTGLDQLFGCVHLPGNDYSGVACLASRPNGGRRNYFLITFDPVQGVANTPVPIDGTVAAGLGSGFLTTY